MPDITFASLIAVPVLLAALVAFLYFISRASFGSFDKVSERYPLSPLRVRPSRWMNVSPGFGGYEGSRNGMKLSADAEGIYLEVIWMFRFGQSPAFIPWSDISIVNCKVWKIFESKMVSFHGLPDVKMTLSLRDWNRAAKNFSGHWPH